MDAELKPETTILKNVNWLTSDMDGETVMMDIDSGHYFSLSTVGSTIWNLIDNPITVAEIFKKLMEEYEVSKEQCEKETMLFLKMTLKAKIVRIIE